MEVFLNKGVRKICSKFTGEHPCWGFPKNTLGGLLLSILNFAGKLSTRCETVPENKTNTVFWKNSTVVKRRYYWVEIKTFSTYFWRRWYFGDVTTMLSNLQSFIVVSEKFYPQFQNSYFLKKYFAEEVFIGLLLSADWAKSETKTAKYFWGKTYEWT